MRNHPSQDESPLASLPGGRALSTLESGGDLKPVMMLHPRLGLWAVMIPANVENNVLHIRSQTLPIGFICPVTQQLL